MFLQVSWGWYFENIIVPKTVIPLSIIFVFKQQVQIWPSSMMLVIIVDNYTIPDNDSISDTSWQ